MDYYCEVCYICVYLYGKYKHFKSNYHKEFDKCKHIKLTIQNPNTNVMDEKFYAYNIEHNEKYAYYLIKCEFKLVFNDIQYCPYVKSELYSNKTMCFWYRFLEKLFTDFKNKGHNFNHIEGKNIITIVMNWMCHMITVSNIKCVVLNGN